jgi:murein DD-endopeptidase MepM/ murein hydrolase activator NlpD
VKRPAVRPARLISLLLGTALLVPLTWCLVRSERDDVSEEMPVPAPRTRTPLQAARAAEPAPVALPERRRGNDATSDAPPKGLLIPVAGVDSRDLQDTYSQSRGSARSHDALDILAPRGTPVFAVDDGVVRKLFTSVRGGLTVYQFGLEERYCFYYAHLDGYAPGLHEGKLLRRGDLVGFVGTTGNARQDAPHLHFAVTRLDADRKWWGGTPVNPYPLLVRAR